MEGRSQQSFLLKSVTLKWLQLGTSSAEDRAKRSGSFLGQREHNSLNILLLQFHACIWNVSSVAFIQRKECVEGNKSHGIRMLVPRIEVLMSVNVHFDAGRFRRNLDFCQTFFKQYYKLTIPNVHFIVISRM